MPQADFEMQTENAGRRVRVLLAEDDIHALNGYLEFLASAGFDATGVPDGTEALAIAHRDLPDVIVTDVSMPGLDGFELAVELRAEGRTRGIPIIGMTAHWTAEVRMTAARVGIGALLLKPCLPDHMVAEVRRALQGCAPKADPASPLLRAPIAR